MLDSRLDLHQSLSLTLENLRHSRILSTLAERLEQEKTIESEREYYVVFCLMSRLQNLTQETETNSQDLTHPICELIAAIEEASNHVKLPEFTSLMTQLSHYGDAKLIKVYREQAKQAEKTLQAKQSQLKEQIEFLHSQPESTLTKKCIALCTTAYDEIDRYFRLGSFSLYLKNLQDALANVLKKASRAGVAKLYFQFFDYLNSRQPSDLFAPSDETMVRNLFECNGVYHWALKENALFAKEDFPSLQDAVKAKDKLAAFLAEKYHQAPPNILILIHPDSDTPPFNLSIDLDEYCRFRDITAATPEQVIRDVQDDLNGAGNLIWSRDVEKNVLRTQPIKHAKDVIDLLTIQCLQAGLLPLPGLFSISRRKTSAENGVIEEFVEIHLEELDKALRLPAALGNDYLTSHELAVAIKSHVQSMYGSLQTTYPTEQAAAERLEQMKQRAALTGLAISEFNPFRIQAKGKKYQIAINLDDYQKLISPKANMDLLSMKLVHDIFLDKTLGTPFLDPIDESDFLDQLSLASSADTSSVSVELTHDFSTQTTEPATSETSAMQPSSTVIEFVSTTEQPVEPSHFILTEEKTSDPRNDFQQHLVQLLQDIQEAAPYKTLLAAETPPTEIAQHDFYILNYLLSVTASITEYLERNPDALSDDNVYHLLIQQVSRATAFIAASFETEDTIVAELVARFSQYAKPNVVQAYQNAIPELNQIFQMKRVELAQYRAQLDLDSALTDNQLSAERAWVSDAIAEFDYYDRFGPIYAEKLADELSRIATQHFFCQISLWRLKKESKANSSYHVLSVEQDFDSLDEAEQAKEQLEKRFDAKYKIYKETVSSPIILSSNHDQPPFKVGINLALYRRVILGGNDCSLEEIVQLAHEDFAGAIDFTWQPDHTGHTLLSQPTHHPEAVISIMTDRCIRAGLTPASDVFATYTESLEEKAIKTIVTIDLQKMEQAICSAKPSLPALKLVGDTFAALSQIDTNTRQTLDLVGSLKNLVAAMRYDYAQLADTTIGHRIKTWAYLPFFLQKKVGTPTFILQAEKILHSEKPAADKITEVTQLLINRAAKFKQDHPRFNNLLQSSRDDHHGARMTFGILQNLFNLSAKNSALTEVASQIKQSGALYRVAACNLARYTHLNQVIATLPDALKGNFFDDLPKPSLARESTAAEPTFVEEKTFAPDEQPTEDTQTVVIIDEQKSVDEQPVEASRVSQNPQPNTVPLAKEEPLEKIPERLLGWLEIQKNSLSEDYPQLKSSKPHGLKKFTSLFSSRMSTFHLINQINEILKSGKDTETQLTLIVDAFIERIKQFKKDNKKHLAAELSKMEKGEHEGTRMVIGILQHFFFELLVKYEKDLPLAKNLAEKIRNGANMAHTVPTRYDTAFAKYKELSTTINLALEQISPEVVHLRKR